MQLAWLTDIHLNFIGTDERQKFYHAINETNADAVVISGDIAEAPSIAKMLTEMATHLKKPIYFVLGNHDYYKGNVKQVREEITSLTKNAEHLFWLPASGPILVEKNIVLLGQDGWADGRYGDYEGSDVVLNDSLLIADLFQEKLLSKDRLLMKMQELADRDAQLLQADLTKAIDNYSPKKIIALIHVPPFREACMHEGQISGEDWLPYFSSKAMGDILLAVAKKHKNTEFLVLSGHTHSPAVYQPLKNLTVRAGQAEYNQPKVQECISI